jgi:hypothetical protein
MTKPGPSFQLYKILCVWYALTMQYLPKQSSANYLNIIGDKIEKRESMQKIIIVSPLERTRGVNKLLQWHR